MDAQLTMRAADHDRQQVVDRLRSAMADGRLTVDEFVDRMGRAYQAVTYGDLAPLSADLPVGQPDGTAGLAGGAGSLAGNGTPVPAAVRPAGCARPGVLAGLPSGLRMLWRIWLTAVSVSVVVWVLVGVTSGHLAHPWPLWVAGPWGAVLFAQSVGCTQSRRGRASRAAGAPPGNG